MPVCVSCCIRRYADRAAVARPAIIFEQRREIPGDVAEPSSNSAQCRAVTRVAFYRQNS